MWKEISSKRLTIVHGFQPESENDSNQKEHLNRGAERQLSNTFQRALMMAQKTFYILGQLHESLHKGLVEGLLHEDPAGGETDLTLVGKAGAHHRGQALR